MKLQNNITLRWVAVAPLALLTMFVMQLVLFMIIMTAFSQFGYGSDLSWPRWVAKSITAPFMGFGFVWVAWKMAPRWKNRVALMAFCLIVAWSGAFLYGAFAEGDVHEWLFTMGATGMLGGLAGYLATKISRLDD